MDANPFEGLRADLRAADQLRPVSMQLGIAPAATGSCLVSFGNTQVICGVTIEDKVPAWMRYQKIPGGWLTAEYTMLPYSTGERTQRAGASPNGRSMEIQRLIGRSLRAAIDLKTLGPRTVWVDCDVLRADGGTRTAAITGGYVALAAAVRKLLDSGSLTQDPMIAQIAAISVGIVRGTPMLDLCYEEDVAATTDTNTVMTAMGNFIEVQGTAEDGAYTRDELIAMLDLAEKGCRELVEMQRKCLQSLGG